MKEPWIGYSVFKERTAGHNESQTMSHDEFYATMKKGDRVRSWADCPD